MKSSNNKKNWHLDPYANISLENIEVQEIKNLVCDIYMPAVYKYEESTVYIMLFSWKWLVGPNLLD